MYYYKILTEFEDFIKNKFYEIMENIQPIDTRSGKIAFKKAELIIAQHINKVREIFDIYEEKTDLLFKSDYPNNQLALNLYETFLNGIDAQLHLKKEIFTIEALELALTIKNIDNDFKALTN